MNTMKKKEKLKEFSCLNHSTLNIKSVITPNIMMKSSQRFAPINLNPNPTSTDIWVCATGQSASYVNGSYYGSVNCYNSMTNEAVTIYWVV